MTPKTRRTQKARRDASGARHAYFQANPWCEARVYGVCTGMADHVHEPLTRARGGAIDDPENMLSVCWGCHAWIHDHPAISTEKGWLRSKS